MTQVKNLVAKVVEYKPKNGAVLYEVRFRETIEENWTALDLHATLKEAIKQKNFILSQA